jgi:hypothetical protein
MTEFTQDPVPTPAAADDPRLVERRCVLITEAREVGWGDGHACTADEITEAARRELTGS